ncbi:MAG TPA: methyl-accepting chemotaxis protein [Oceanospirillales bacterium]|jgi:methyl-accepting chemotaxis protein|nr:methyl-accepting chemotaxis protein [Oceanospirillales bacterium]
MSMLDSLKLKTLLAGGMALALLLTIIISSFININQFSNMFYEVTENEHLPNVTERAKAQINASLATPIALSQGIAQNHYIQQWVLNGEDEAGIEALKNYGQRFIAEQGASAFFLVSSLSNNYYTQGGLFKQVSRNKPRDEWFYSTVDNKKDLALNLDIGEMSGALTVYVNVLAKSADGQVLGVAGLGLDVSDIIHLIKETKVGEEGYMFLLDGSGSITAHKDSSVLNQSLSDIPMFSAIASSINDSEGEFTLIDGVVDNEDAYVAVTELKNLGWKLVTVQPKAEIAGKVNAVVQLSVILAVILGIIFVLLSTYIASRVSRSITQIGDKLHNMSDSGGDLTMRLDDSSGTELGYLASGFNAILGKFSDLVKEIQEAQAAINSGVNNLKRTSLESVEYAENQRGQTDMVASAITEMGQTINEVSSIAHRTAEDTSSAVKDTRETNDVMLNLANTMTELADNMKQSEASITDLASQTESINSVVDVISSISEQTNLLALNAAIEAARAGEQGRGFAVVADEVRTLASRTQDSTQEIRSQIEQLQIAATNSLKSIQDGSQKSLALADISQSASSSLSTIRGRFDAISDGNHQVAAATEEQAAVVDHINDSAHNISDMSNKIHDSSKSQLEEIDTLNTRAQHMGVIISLFKV